MRELNLTIRFACELLMLAALVWWGWPVVGWVAAGAVAVFWGAFMAPKAARRWRDPARFLAELVLFAAATAAFVAVGRTAWAIVFAAAATVSAALVRIWPEQFG